MDAIRLSDVNLQEAAIRDAISAADHIVAVDERGQATDFYGRPLQEAFNLNGRPRPSKELKVHYDSRTDCLGVLYEACIALKGQCLYSLRA